MEHRTLGRTGLEVSILGFGGFHLLEIPTQEATKLLNRYLDQGGNYIETAADYGDGESERKIGEVIAKRREEVILASKTSSRDKQGARVDIERSLKNLQTDYLDLIFMHGVGTEEELETILSSGGAMETVRELQAAGKVGHLAISMHGQPDVLIKALETDEFDVVMATLNYFDRFNFPKLESELIPLAQNNNIGIICMKPIADGFLWRSAKKAFRYSFSLPVSMVVTGMNSLEMLETDIELANNFTPMTNREKEKLFSEAPELGDYICRQCDKCYACPEEIDIKEIFKLEGYYDRQMRDGKPRNPEKFALRDRLRFWFGNDGLAQELYQQLKVQADSCTKCQQCLEYCPYDLPIIDKLEMSHYKLGSDDSIF
ncbi:putative oxidoreductase of aldo/keto reductase family [Halobacteroides halobius DSM 5150]|uniref:Putative oxidoreductase of aldo/keto reductase family n=1 Tax=Halobacteroides halobius (strain ATCC 35273 / DSM 5150 / MD-1) TaxID=748449 RepID=L0KC63_HALHC|nr:aldo/keto reductase [Halobacteroides halobius]AGB41673.1 putative oxidoreductase of aldo/keto reductase family [Halobacteroides halobius DSM 5150]